MPGREFFNQDFLMKCQKVLLVSYKEPFPPKTVFVCCEWSCIVFTQIDQGWLHSRFKLTAKASEKRPVALFTERIIFQLHRFPGVKSLAVSRKVTWRTSRQTLWRRRQVCAQGRMILDLASRMLRLFPTGREPCSPEQWSRATPRFGWVFLEICRGDEILPMYVGIIISHYKEFLWTSPYNGCHMGFWLLLSWGYKTNPS